VVAVSGELAVDADQAVVVVDVGPGEAERFADGDAGVGEELEQWSPCSCVLEETCELAAFEDGGGLGYQRGFSPSSSLATGLSASHPRRTANRQTWLGAIRAMCAVVGASVRSFVCDQAATRSMLRSRSLQAPIGRALQWAHA
jgi:hypothetical protein